MRQPGGGTARAGRLLEWLIQRWISLSGRLVNTSDEPWLAGPIGGASIGAGVYEEYARAAGLEIDTLQAPAGPLADFSVPESAEFVPDGVDEEVRRFYEQTSLFSFDGWSE